MRMVVAVDDVGNKQDWDLAFEHGYEDGFKKTHSRQ
jgi:hypothetical protein